MYKVRTKFLVTALAIFAMLSMVVVAPTVSDDSSAEYIGDTQLTMIYDEEMNVTVNAGNTAYLTFTVCSDYTEDMFIYIKCKVNSSDITTSETHYQGAIKKSSYNEITIPISADKYASQGNYSLDVYFEVHDSHNNIDSGSYAFDLRVDSDLSSANQYNRFMGTWDNTLPSPFGDAWFAALVTGLVWLLVGFLVRLVAVPIVMKLIMKKDDPDYDAMKTTLTRMCFIIIVLNGIGKAIRVLGLNEETIDMVNVVFYICYVIVAAMVIWRVYILIINVLVKKIGTRDFIPGGSKSDFDSLKPLFMYIGEIVLTVASIGAIMSVLGFNMTAIITSAGIVSLGITLGAQNVLSQFFSGLVILSTRPFKKGDLITLNGGSITYRVRKVNIMQTELENWDNTDITLVPNSTLTSGVIKNITRDTLKCKIHVFISVGYNNDLAYVRAAMLEVANSNPRVIKDGSVGRPSTRVTDFEDSNIQMRLSVYVDDFNDSGVIGGELRQAMYDKFKEKGISIDYTNIVVRPYAPDDDKESE